MKVFITGIRGFLGSNLAAALTMRGHQVKGSASQPGGAHICIQIGEPVHPSYFEDADVVVHCAHDFRPDAVEQNVSGSRLLFNAAAGRRRILISSHSAREDAFSEYGISKYLMECFWHGDAETIIRPGLVIGAGGAFGRRLPVLRKTPVLPLIDGGRDPIPVLAIADFRVAMVRLIESDSTPLPAYNLFNERQPTLREIVKTVLRIDSRRALLLPVPIKLAYMAMRLRFPLPFDAASLRTLQLNRNSIHTSNMRALIDGETRLEVALRAAISR